MSGLIKVLLSLFLLTTVKESFPPADMCPARNNTGNAYLDSLSTHVCRYGAQKVAYPNVVDFYCPADTFLQEHSNLSSDDLYHMHALATAQQFHRRRPNTWKILEHLKSWCDAGKLQDAQSAYKWAGRKELCAIVAQGNLPYWERVKNP